MHHVAHPELACLVEGEAPPVFAGRLLGPLVHESVAGQEPVHGRGRQVQIVSRGGFDLLDQGSDRQRRLGLLHEAERVRDLLRDRPRMALITSRLGTQGIEAASSVRR